MNSHKECSHPSHVFQQTSTGTKISLWWLRHYEDICQLWRGFSWIWAIFILFYVLVGYLDFAVALPILFIVGVVANSGLYFSIRAISSHLKHLPEGPEKEEAHELMIKIIKRRVFQGS